MCMWLRELRVRTIDRLLRHARKRDENGKVCRCPSWHVILWIYRSRSFVIAHLCSVEGAPFNWKKILMKILTKSCQNVTAKKINNMNKYVIDACLPFKFDFCEDFQDDFFPIESVPSTMLTCGQFPWEGVSEGQQPERGLVRGRRKAGRGERERRREGERGRGPTLKRMRQTCCNK